MTVVIKVDVNYSFPDAVHVHLKLNHNYVANPYISTLLLIIVPMQEDQ